MKKILLFTLLASGCFGSSSGLPCYQVKSVHDCTQSTFISVGACAVITEEAKRITVLRPVIKGDTVCNYRKNFYKVKGQPVVK